MWNEKKGEERKEGRRIDRDWKVEFKKYMMKIEIDERIGERKWRNKGMSVGMKRMKIKKGLGGILKDEEKINEGKGVRDMEKKRKVMGNEKIRCKEKIMNIMKEIKEKGMKGKIERREGIIKKNEMRIEGKGKRNK